MGALFQSRGWLPIVEAPGYFRHPTYILAMQLLTYLNEIPPYFIHEIKTNDYNVIVIIVFAAFLNEIPAQKRG